MQRSLIEQRDKSDGVSMEDKKKNRVDIPPFKPSPKADAWQTGETYQLKYEKQ